MVIIHKNKSNPFNKFLVNQFVATTAYPNENNYFFYICLYHSATRTHCSCKKTKCNRHHG